MYTIILDQGLVVRDNDNKVVAPCQSDQDPDFIEYNLWASTEGNVPRTYDTYDGYLQAGNPPVLATE